MSALMLSEECGGGLAYHPFLGPLVSVKRCEDCPGGETRSGLLGGWSCSCECHLAGSRKGSQAGCSHQSGPPHVRQFCHCAGSPEGSPVAPGNAGSGEAS